MQAKWLSWLAVPALVGGCAQSSIESDVSVRVSQKNNSVRGTSLALRANDSETGQDLDIEEVQIEEQDSDGNWHPVTNHVTGADDAGLDVVLVADNSGSQKSVEQRIRNASRAVGESLLSLGDYARVGMVRVSTQVSVLTELTDDPAAVQAAADAQFVNRGWTSLYDGVRVANEVLDRGVDPNSDPCENPVFRGILMFTNGAENNSADQHSDKAEGDGIDTSLEDLLAQSVGGDRPPMFAVGIGDRVDAEALQQLADSTGGVYTEALDYDALQVALLSAAQSFWNAKLVCIPNDEVAGCDGVMGSGKVVDACGVCDGDGSSCAGCDGVANSNTVFDACGVCAGDGSSCEGCDGSPYSGKVLDACGVCGGNNACVGCDGVPNSGRTWDAMGVCGGNGSTGATCAGKSGKRLDACGKCGGDGSTCRGCDGRPGSGKQLDACGVCGGDGSSCQGCDGISASGATYDLCGVCGGNGSTCADDEDEDEDDGDCTPGNGNGNGNPGNGNNGNDKCVGNAGGNGNGGGNRRATLRVRTSSGETVTQQVAL